MARGSKKTSRVEEQRKASTPKVTAGGTPGGPPRSVLGTNPPHRYGPDPHERLPLGCGRCGRAGIYDVGRIAVSAELPLEARSEEAIGFTGYFRCRACDAAGPWTFLPSTMARLVELMAELCHANGPSARSGAVIRGDMRLFDGTRIRFATDGEAHLEALIAKAPEDPFLRDRLGNLYLASGRPDLARAAFEAALEKRPTYVPSLHTLGELHEKAGDDRTAASFFHRLVETAPVTADVSRADLVAVLRSALYSLYAIHERTGGEVPVLPARPGLSGEGEAPPQIAATISVDAEGRLHAEVDLDVLVDRILAGNLYAPLPPG